MVVGTVLLRDAAVEADCATMPGMPPAGTVEELARLKGCAFDERFRPVMIAYHKGGSP